MDKYPSVNLTSKILLALTLFAGLMPSGRGSPAHPNPAQNGFVPLAAAIVRGVLAYEHAVKS